MTFFWDCIPAYSPTWLLGQAEIFFDLNRSYAARDTAI